MARRSIRSEAQDIDESPLIEELRRLQEEIATLRESIDKWREDVQHAILNLNRGFEITQPAESDGDWQAVPSQCKGPEGEATLQDDPPTATIEIQSRWNQLRSAVDAMEWAVVRQLGYGILDYLGNGGEPPSVVGWEDLSSEDRREAAYDLACEWMKTALNVMADRADATKENPAGAAAEGNQQSLFW